MPVQWPIDKLTLCNSALAATGNNLVNVADDGSDEWAVCSPAYERALAFMLEDHGWVHATKVNPNLAASPTAPADDLFDTAYPIPADCLHLIWVRQNDQPAIYGILAGQIVVRAAGLPGSLSIKYVSTDNSDATEATPTFIAALEEFVMARIYRGLHGDTAAADKSEQKAMTILQRAKTRSDQQKPRTALFNSRLRTARRMRRPWPADPGTWGGTGVPGS